MITAVGGGLENAAGTAALSTGPAAIVLIPPATGLIHFATEKAVEAVCK